MTMRRRVMYLAWAPFFSGAERAMLMTLRALDTSRYEPYVLAGTHGEFAAQVRALGIRCDVVPIARLDRAKPFSSSFSVARVAAAALRFRPAIIHANDMPSYQPGGYAARLLAIPSTNAEKRLLSFATSRTIERMVGMSVYSMPRPRP